MAWFGLVRHFGVGLGWIGMFWVDLAWFKLVWVVLGCFGSFWIASDSEHFPPSARDPAQLPPTPRHPGEPGVHWPAPPSAHAALLVIGRPFTQSFTFRRSDWLALGRRGARVPRGGGRGAGPGARCVIAGGVPGNIPGGISCHHGALLPGAESHPPGEGSGENRRGGRLGVAVAMSTGAGRSAHARALVSWR